MRITQIVKALPFLPASWISSKIYQNKTQEESQIRLEKWSTLILKVLGYRLQVQGVENVPKMCIRDRLNVYTLFPLYKRL